MRHGKRVLAVILATQFVRSIGLNTVLFLFWRQIGSWMAIPSAGWRVKTTGLKAEMDKIAREHVRLGIHRAHASMRAVGCDLGHGPRTAADIVFEPTE